MPFVFVRCSVEFELVVFLGDGVGVLSRRLWVRHRREAAPICSSRPRVQGSVDRNGAREQALRPRPRNESHGSRGQVAQAYAPLPTLPHQVQVAERPRRAQVSAPEDQTQQGCKEELSLPAGREVLFRVAACGAKHGSPTRLILKSDTPIHTDHSEPAPPPFVG